MYLLRASYLLHGQGIDDDHGASPTFRIKRDGQQHPIILGCRIGFSNEDRLRRHVVRRRGPDTGCLGLRVNLDDRVGEVAPLFDVDAVAGIGDDWSVSTKQGQESVTM